MPRRTLSKKRAAAAAAANPPHEDHDRFASSNSAYSQSDRIDKLFKTYANASSGLIEPEGIELLCSNLGVAHTDIRILMLAWKMQAGKQGYFTLEEWRKGSNELKADTIVKLKNALRKLEEEVVTSEPNFVDFYVYAFKYCLTELNQKCVEIESVCVLVELILGPWYKPQVAALVEYLKTQEDYKVITMDQWMGFYRFLNEVSFPDFKNYDEELAWPLILDNFVEWMREKQ